MQEPVIAPHNPQHNLGRNRSSASDLNESIMNPIDKVISGLRYSSIPYISFETQINPNQHSRERVVRSEDGWFKHWEENVRDASKESITASGHTDSPQMPELDSDTDSSSSASSTYSSQAKNWLRTTDEVVRGDSLEEGHDKKLSQSHGNEAPYLKKVKGHINPQDIPLKGMARLRRISPKAISTTGLLDVESNRLSFIFITWSLAYHFLSVLRRHFISLPRVNNNSCLLLIP